MEKFRLRTTVFLALAVLSLLTETGSTPVPCPDANTNVCPSKTICYKPKESNTNLKCSCVSIGASAMKDVLEECVPVPLSLGKSSRAGGLKRSFPVSLVFVLITITAIA